MLVIKRRIGEAVIIDGVIKVRILDMFDGKVKIGIDAPLEVLVLREELEPNGILPTPIPPILKGEQPA